MVSIPKLPILPVVIPVGLVVIILIVVLWYFLNKNKKIYKKLFLEKSRFQRYKKGIENLKNNPGTPNEDFKILNRYVRAFFKEYLNLKPNLTYLELAKNFKKQKKSKYEKFSRLMSDIDYKGQKTNKDLNQAINSFEKIIKNY
tara:strand:+ start:9349 stop:9777 length:429 start_codon:yes stop_codon:yes gene_type:complete